MNFSGGGGGAAMLFLLPRNILRAQMRRFHVVPILPLRHESPHHKRRSAQEPFVLSHHSFRIRNGLPLRRGFATNIHDEQLQSFLSSGLYREAMEFLIELSPQSSCIRTWKSQAYYRLFHATLLHHRSLVDTYNNSFRGTVTNTEPALAEPTQLHVLQEMVQYAEMAHNILERIEPFLGARNVWLDNISAVSSSNEANEFQGKLLIGAEANEESNRASDISVPKVKAHLDPVSKRPDGNVGAHDNLDVTAVPIASVQPIEIVKGEVDVELLKCCHDVLQAWASTVRAGYKGRASRTYIRAIPQRAHFLLSRMEISMDDTSSHPTFHKCLPPSLADYNAVLEAWAFSREHLRGATAQRIFDKLATRKKKKADAILPDGISCRLILWAWALSRETRAAFTATGHLIKMLKRLESSFDKDAKDEEFEGEAIEPNIEDYHIVLKAWTRSEYVLSNVCTLPRTCTALTFLS
jgi:hypothetical protein